MTKWRKIKDYPQPPAHTQLVFRCDNGQIYSGDMCYGMHEAWFCIHYLRGETQVLRDFNVKVTHWCLREELEKEMGID